MAIQRFSHIGICISNLDQSLKFYSDVLGFSELSRMDFEGEQTGRLLEIQDVRLTVAFLERDGIRIELMEYRHPDAIQLQHRHPMNQIGITHLSFRVTDLPSLLGRIKAANGVHIEHARYENAEFGSVAVFVVDPDGIRIELLESQGDPNRVPGSPPSG